jgi:hypothetical protein
MEYLISYNSKTNIIASSTDVSGSNITQVLSDGPSEGRVALLTGWNNCCQRPVFIPRTSTIRSNKVQ